MLKDNKDVPDICETIHSPEKIDPFEGLNLDEICVSPQNLVPPSSEDNEVESESNEEASELFGLNPLDGIDLKDLSITPESLTSRQAREKFPPTAQDDVNFLLIPDEEADDSAQQKKQEPIRPQRSLSTDIALPPAKTKQFFIDPTIEKAYHYAELTQIREKVFASLEKSDGNTLLIASPHDNTGSTLLAAALGYNAACSCQKNVLLIDCNMRRAGLHSLFNLPQSYGFTELIQNNLPWQAVVKDTGIENLHMITAGDPCDNFSEYLRHSHIPNLLKKIRYEFDLIILDTSPVLTPNRNNVTIVSLTSVVDYFLLIIKKSGTTKDHLKETVTVIEAGNGTIDGIVLNEHTPASRPKPYSK
ncbi:MAG: CpsD/CapB family tyrosine-protein kinase [Proteobacteria bacterium]|nr:CpsD/CapB family tyrosine-protein kinase [Pseudomonadota bacterium]MBU1059304.1 CpsD/CapB family tyrosine-protein kinase [Pseudomonadota bacterium]